jgi:rhodanese-related sulfurtransferase
MVQQLPPSQAAQWLRERAQETCLLDVREPWEIETARVAGSLNIPMGQLTQRLNEIPDDKALIVLCHHGVRSNAVAHFLVRNGFAPVYNTQGGIDAWSQQVDQSIPLY